MDDKNKIKIVFESLGLDSVITKLNDFSKKLTDTNKSISLSTNTSKTLDNALLKNAYSFDSISSNINLSSNSLMGFKNASAILRESKNDFDILSSRVEAQRKNFLELKNTVGESSQSYDTSSIENISREMLSINMELAESSEAIYSDMQNMIIASQYNLVDNIKGINSSISDDYDNITNSIVDSNRNANAEITVSADSNIRNLSKTATESDSLIKDNSNKTAKEISDTTKNMESDFDNSIKNMDSNFNSFFNSIRNRKSEIEGLSTTMTSLSSITSSVGSISKMVFKSKLEDLSSYDAAIEQLKNKEIENIATTSNVKKENSDIENEEYIIRLENEYQRSVEASDLISANAIQNKMKEVNALKDKKEVEKKNNYEIATAEYNKSMAAYNNNVKIAEMEKNHAIASGSIMMAEGIAQASLGVAKSVAQLGPIAGLALGLSTAATLIASISSGVSSIKGASANLESVKAASPTPPKFRYGTEGFSLKLGESAIVGEESEVIKNRDGDLQVMSVEKTKNNFSAGGFVINTLNLFVEDITSRDDIIEVLKDIKERGMSYAI